MQIFIPQNLKREKRLLFSFKLNKKHAIERYINEVLKNSQYPEAVTDDYEIEYNEETMRIIILYKISNPK